MATNNIKAVRPNRLTERETLTTFEDWRNNLEFFLQQDARFTEFLKSTTTWNKASNTADHRGLADDAAAKTLQQFLGVIASLCPPLLHGDITDDTKSLADVYKLLRSYYQFAPSESTFIKFATIKREVIEGNLERPLHLYLRMRQFIRDNLLMSSGRIQHDGAIPTTDEKLSPTTERLIVLRWMEILHPNLPSHVANVFAHELQTISLKDLQPRITDQIDDLLHQLETKSNDIDAQFSRLSTKDRKYKDYRQPYNSNRRNPRDNVQKRAQFSTRQPYQSVKKCEACRSVGEPFIGHELRECPNISPSNRVSLLKTFNLEVNDEDELDDENEVDLKYAHLELQDIMNDDVIVERVDIVASPQFNVKINSAMITMVLDTGATGSMISLELCELAKLNVYPSTHSAVLADGDSQLHVVGEVHTSILMDNYLKLPISAVVVTRLKAGMIVGMSFMKNHKIVIDIPNSVLIFPGHKTVNFNNKPGNPKVCLLKADVNNVIFPGDTVTLPVPANFHADSSLAVEPREENLKWPEPCIIDIKEGHLSIQNNSEEPITLKKNQVVAQLRSVINPQEEIAYQSVPRAKEVTQNPDFTTSIKIDPNNVLLTDEEKSTFNGINKSYNSVFNSDIQTYNDHSGKIRATVCLGNTKPIPKKGKVPCYNSKNSSILQQKFDELAELGILSRPEDVNVDVVHTSPSFLVKKPDGDHRLVTSFVELNKYIRPLPSKLSTTKDVLTAIGKWKYIIKSDLKSAYFQIPMMPDSQKWLGTNSPFKGMFVYNRAPMGLRNMAEYLEELVSRVLGDFIAEGFLTKISDDLIIGANTVQDLASNWERTLQRLKENNLSISPDKTFICPQSVKIVGWIWKSGKLEVDMHRINPLTTCAPPTNVKKMRSFIGAARIISRCIPKYATYLHDLEDVVAGKESTEKITWDNALTEKFKKAQKALENPKVITIPHPDDQLILVSDGCNSPAAVGSTLYIKRGSKEYIAGFFSAKVKKTQLLWLPCEIEALGINLSINTFKNYINESKHQTKFLTDSKACVGAFQKLSQGGFSLSPRISSFLMNLNSVNVAIEYVKGSSIKLTDFSSRNPIECNDEKCQVCKFIDENVNLAVRSISVDEIENGNLKMPFYNMNAWQEAQKQDPDLKRAYSQLSAGTRPGKKEKNLKILRTYLRIASISERDVLVCRKPNPYGRDYEAIIVPQSLAPGLIAALHIRLAHPTKTQLKKLWSKYFFSIDSDALIDNCTDSCSLCTSLKTIPKELLEQSTSQVPDSIGKVFAADVLRRETQKVFIIIDIFSSFMLGVIIPNEQGETLQQALIQLTASYKHPQGCMIRVDNAPGFKCLKDDKVLSAVGIKLDFGRIKNKNKNPCVDKAIQEIEEEIKRLAPSGGPINQGTLAIAISNNNNRIRASGLSSKEILIKRDHFTNQPIQIDDEQLKDFRYKRRLINHPHSELSKSRGNPPPQIETISKGDIVHVKSELTKHTAREYYIVVSVNYERKQAEIQKLYGNQLRMKKYLVNLSEIYLASPRIVKHKSADPSDDDDGVHLHSEATEDNVRLQEEARESPGEEGIAPDDVSLRRSERRRTTPQWLATDEIQRTT